MGRLDDLGEPWSSGSPAVLDEGLAGARGPDVYYYPPSLEQDTSAGVLHAKGVVVDDEAVFVTTANFTEAALDRNIEVGLLSRDRTLAASLATHFRVLIERELLLPLP